MLFSSLRSYFIIFWSFNYFITIMNFFFFWLKKVGGKKTRKSKHFKKRMLFHSCASLLRHHQVMLLLWTRAPLLPLCSLETHMLYTSRWAFILDIRWWVFGCRLMESERKTAWRSCYNIFPEIQLWQDEDTLFFLTSTFLRFSPEVSRKNNQNQCIIGFQKKYLMFSLISKSLYLLTWVLKSP